MFRNLILGASIAALSACTQIAPDAGAQEDTPTVEVTELRDGLYFLEGEGGNVGISVGEDGVLVIDDQYARMEAPIRDAIADLTDQDVKYIINTHWHGDHTGGNQAFSETGAIIIAHDNVYERLSTDQYNELFDRTTPAAPEAAWPEISYSHEMTVHLNGEDIWLMHIWGAHTDGDSIVFFKNANVVHMGDTLFHGRFPFIDISSGGSIDGMLIAQELVLDRIDDDTIVIPGHGPLTDKAGLQADRDMLKDVRERMARALEAGKSLEEVLAEKPLADLAEQYDWGFIDQDTMVTLAYKSLYKADTGD